MVTPGMTLCGLVSHASSLVSSQAKSAFDCVSEYLNPSALPAGRPTTFTNGGPCRIGSDELNVWHTAHCCLNSVAPSGGFAAGNGSCALAIPATSTIAVHNPGTITRIAKNPPVHISVRKL